MERVFEKAAPERDQWGIPAVSAGVLRDGRAATAAFGDCTPDTAFRIAWKRAAGRRLLQALRDGMLDPLGSRRPASSRRERRATSRLVPGRFLRLGSLLDRVEE